MNVRHAIADALSAVRDLVVYSDSLADARSRGMVIFADLDKALLALAEAEVRTAFPPNRFAIQLPATQVFITEGYLGDGGRYAEAPARTVYFIEGFATESKILAIKQVRQLDNSGLKEAKDFVDGLAARPLFTNKS
jgi:ribosomal protein L7/L12